MGELKRIDSFDILKTIAIFLVVFCHFTLFENTVAENFCMTICYIGVPIFFMVNGALLLKKSLDLKKHLLRTATIYVVATVWRCIYLIIYVLKSGFLNEILTRKQETLSYIFLWSDSSLFSTGHMWFMESLLAIYLIFPLLHICFKTEKVGRNSLILLLIVIFIGIMCVTEFDIAVSLINKNFSKNIIISTKPLNNFMPYSQGMAIFYFVLGGLLSQRLDGYENFPKIEIKIKHRIILLTVFLSSWLLMMYTKSLIDGTWAWNGVLYTSGYHRIPTLLASLSLFALFYDINIKNKIVRTVFKTVSSYTLGIYYIHWWLLPFIISYFTSKGLIENTLKTIITLLISCGIIFVTNFVPVLRKLVR